MRFPGFGRSPERPPVDLETGGERLLAWARADGDRAIGGTREALYLVIEPGATPVRLPWEQVEAADWDEDTTTFRCSEVGTFGVPRAAYQLVLDEPGRVLELVRERVTASIVLQRHVPVRGRRGVRVVGRRAPSGHGEIEWFFEYDEGVDPTDPAVAPVAEEALRAARADVET